MAHTFGFSAHEKGLEFCCYTAPDVPDVLVGDGARLRQVLVNLAANAIKFTDVGGVLIDVRAERGLPDATTLHVTVSDTGCGVPVNKRREIFEPFTQADASSTRRHQGTGLGLPISVQLVELMGGRLWFEDRAGPGSTFHFTATLGLEPNAETPPCSPPLLAPLLGCRALVADSHDVARAGVVEQLNAWGMACVGCPDAASALIALQTALDRKAPFRLAIIDGSLPELDVLCDAILADSRIAQTTIMLRPILASDGPPLRHLHPQIAAYCTKPATRQRLVEALAAGCDFADVGAPGTGVAPPAVNDPVVPRRVLIAEDSTTNRHLVEHLLTSRGHRTEGVATGVDALAAVTERQFDVILMDLQMPGMDGFACTNAIRSTEAAETRPLRIVAMTAAALPGDRERCLAAGMDDYLSKPIVLSALYAAVERAPLRDRQPAHPGFHPPAFVARLGGDVDLARRLSRLVLAEAPMRMTQLRRAVEGRDPEGIGAAAHALKGMLGNLGVPEADALAARLEALGLSGDLTEAESLQRALVGVVERITPALRPLADEASDDSHHPQP